MYYGIYKCRICGQTYTRCGTANKNLVIEKFIDLINGNDLNKPNVDLYDMHSCENGSFGLADFQGFKKDESYY